MGGNLTVQEGNPSVYGPDSATSVYLDKYGDPAQPSWGVTGVTDIITLNGSDNLLTNASPLEEKPTPIVNSTISFTVLDDGLNGSNTVSLTHVSSSSVTFIDNSPLGLDIVTIDNRNGDTNVTLSGEENTVSVNSDATNSIVFTQFSGGGDTVTVGYFDDDKFGYASSISLVGTGNTVYGGDADLTISGSTGSLDVLPRRRHRLRQRGVARTTRSRLAAATTRSTPAAADRAFTSSASTRASRNFRATTTTSLFRPPRPTPWRSRASATR